MCVTQRPSKKPSRMIAITAALILLTACEAPQALPVETPPSPSVNPVQVTIDLPAGWSDLIDQYRAEIPNTVLSAVWSPESDLLLAETFATVSAKMYGLGNNPRREVLEDLDSWERDLGNSVRGESGGLETLAGGAGRWGSITGTMNNREKTIFSVHLYHGPYELMVLIETRDPDHTKAYELLDALETVAFSGPTEISERAGRPLDEGGRWYSYCRTISIPVQESWSYEFEPSYDREPWDCPTDVDFLGAWATELDGSDHLISGFHYRDVTLTEVLNSLSLPDAVGESLVSAAGFTHTLVFEETFTLSDGTTGVWSQDRLESPTGEYDFAQLLGFDTPSGGSVLIVLMNSDDEFVDDVDAVFEILNALTVVDIG